MKSVAHGERRLSWAGVIPNLRLDSRAAALVGLAALFALHVTVMLVWLALDTRPPFYDTAGHAIATLQAGRLPWLADPVSAFNTLARTSPYPPLVYLLAAPLARLPLPTADALTLINIPFLGILLASTYGIATRLRGPWTGLLAATLVSAYPILYGLERQYLLDFPAVALVALAVWLVLASDRFERRGVAVAAGLALAAATLVKSTAPVFVAGPFAVVALSGLRTHHMRTVVNAGLAVVIAAAVCAIWYLNSLTVLLKFLSTGHSYAVAEGDPLIGSLASWTYYLQVMPRSQLLLPLTLAFLVGLVLAVANQRRQPGLLFLLSWVGLPYLALSAVLEGKDTRYTMPYLPALAILTALGMMQIRQRWVRTAAVTILLAYASFQYVGLTFGLHRLFPQVIPAVSEVAVGPVGGLLYAEQVHMAAPPKHEDWQVEKILDDVVVAGGNAAGPIALTVVPNIPYFEQNVFAYFAQTRQLNVKIVYVTGVRPIVDVRSEVKASNFIVTKTGSQGPGWTVQEAARLTAELDDRTSDLGSAFVLQGAYALPDGSSARLYRRRS